jgi:hypothetical protein
MVENLTGFCYLEGNGPQRETVPVAPQLRQMIETPFLWLASEKVAYERPHWSASISGGRGTVSPRLGQS